MAIAMEEIMKIVPNLMDMPSNHMWIDYDEEADVLYINFKKPAHADETVMNKDDVILRYEKDNLVGITILAVSKRFKKKRSR